MCQSKTPVVASIAKGWKSSEHLLTWAVVLMPLILPYVQQQAAANPNSPLWTLAAAIAVAFYTWSRAQAKKDVPPEKQAEYIEEAASVKAVEILQNAGVNAPGAPAGPVAPAALAEDGGSPV